MQRVKAVRVIGSCFMTLWLAITVAPVPVHGKYDIPVAPCFMLRRKVPCPMLQLNTIAPVMNLSCCDPYFVTTGRTATE